MTPVFRNDAAFDKHGQPINQYYNARRRLDRMIDELIGLCRGMICDGQVTCNEARYLGNWLEEHQLIIETWPASVLATRIAVMFKKHPDIDATEKKELFDILAEISGPDAFKKYAESASSVLPIDRPVPTIIFDTRFFCLTGEFFFTVPVKNAMLK